MRTPLDNYKRNIRRKLVDQFKWEADAATAYVKLKKDYIKTLHDKGVPSPRASHYIQVLFEKELKDAE